MELGGNAPFLVFGDADLDKAVDGAMLAKMRNIGEACTAANRFIVHESVADEFSAATRRADGRHDASAAASTTASQVGPLVDSAAIDKVTELVADAVDKGATVLTGGSRHRRPRPLLPAHRADRRADQPPRCSARRSSARSPRSSPSTPTQDGIAKANDTEYGLVAYAFTENLTRAITVAEKLETGMVGINQGIVSNPAAPFGGVKESGLGREGGTEGIEEYLETKYVGIKL